MRNKLVIASIVMSHRIKGKDLLAISRGFDSTANCNTNATFLVFLQLFLAHNSVGDT